MNMLQDLNPPYGDVVIRRSKKAASDNCSHDGSQLINSL